MAAGREARCTAGRLMSKLISEETEVDDFYKTAFGGFDEEADDGSYKSESDSDDQVDSDFSMSETDEVIDAASDEDEPSRKKKKMVYKEPKKAQKGEEKSKPKVPRAQKKQSSTPEQTGRLRKSTRSLTVVSSTEHEQRQKKECEKKGYKKQRNVPTLRRLTQEELLAEARITEEQNIASLKAYQLMEADRKKVKIQKTVFKGPVIRFHSLTMPLVQIQEEHEIKVDVDVKDSPQEKMTDECDKKCCRNFLIFTDAKNFPQTYFPTSKQRIPQQSHCPITGLPAKYKDPLTGLPYATAQAFRYIREQYAAKQNENNKTSDDKTQRRRSRKISVE